MALSAGLIGCGNVARRYAIAMNGASAAFRLESVWDLGHEAADIFAEQYHVSRSKSFDEFLSHEYDLVCVCTPNDTHTALVETSLKKGFHVLVEHPPATTLSDAKRLAHLSDEFNRFVFVMRQRRYLRSIQVLRRALVLDLLGTIQNVKGVVAWNRNLEYFKARSWRSRPENGGVILNQGSHFLDILLYLFGEAAFADGVIGNLRHDLPVEDTASVHIIFENGIQADIGCTIAASAGQNRAHLIVLGTKGSVVLTGKHWETIVMKSSPAFSEIVQQFDEEFSGDHAYFLDRVARRLSGAEIEVVDIRQALPLARLIDRIYGTFPVDDSGVRGQLMTLLEDIFNDTDSTQQRLFHRL